MLSVDGSATYNGGALGVYVRNVYNPDSTIASATSGHFTADAMLTANFGGGGLGTDVQNTVTGTIHNFVLSGVEYDDWAVTLRGTIADNAVSGMTDVTPDNMVDDTDGTFNATFHGPSGDVDHDDDSTTDEVNTAPHTVVGEFDADFNNGAVAGGFGARIE